MAYSYRTRGLLVILDSLQTQGMRLPQCGQMATLTRPDLTQLHYVIDDAEQNPDAVIGLYFQGLTSADIPRGTTIQWKSTS